MKRHLTLIVLFLLGSSWASAEHARSFRIEVPFQVHGPERINLERLVERYHNIDLDHYDMHSLVLYAERRHSNGDATLKIGGYSSPHIYIGDELAGHVIPPPVANGRDWRLNIGPGVFVTGIVMDLSPRTPYRNHSYTYGYYYDDHRYRHNRHRFSYNDSRRHYKRKIRHLKHRLRHDYNDRHHRGRDRHRDYDRKRDRRHDRNRDRKHDRNRDRNHDRNRGNDRDRRHDRNRGRDQDRNHDRNRGRSQDRNHDRNRGDRNRDRGRNHDRGRDRGQDGGRGRGRGEQTHRKVMTHSKKLRNHRKLN